jgi:hypothetical protein
VIADHAAPRHDYVAHGGTVGAAQLRQLHRKGAVGCGADGQGYVLGGELLVPLQLHTEGVAAGCAAHNHLARKGRARGGGG